MIPQQRKKWLSPDSSFSRVSVLTAITIMQEKFCFGGISVSVFVRFSFARLGSAPLGSGRFGAREESSRDYRYKKIRHGRVLKWFLTPWRNLWAVLDLLQLLQAKGWWQGRMGMAALPPDHNPCPYTTDNHFFLCCGIINQKMFRRKIKPKLGNNLTFFQMSYYNILKIFVCGRFILKTSSTLPEG